jgi:hypothetical protein
LGVEQGPTEIGEAVDWGGSCGDDFSSFSEFVFRRAACQAFEVDQFDGFVGLGGRAVD